MDELCNRASNSPPANGSSCLDPGDPGAVATLAVLVAAVVLVPGLLRLDSVMSFG
jgi:hypothetical protein